MKGTSCRTWLLLLLFAALAAEQSGAIGPEVQQLCDDYFYWRVQDMPEFGTFVGVHDYDHLLDDLSLSAYEHRLSNTTVFLDRLEQLAPSLDDPDDILNIKVLRDEFETFRDGYPFKTFYIALNNMEGVQMDLVRLLSWMPLTTLEHYYTMLARMEQLPKQIDQVIVLMTNGVNDGIVLHERSMYKVVGQIDNYLEGDVRDSPIYEQFFTTFADNFTQIEVVALQIQASWIIKNMINPAFQKLQDYVATEYVTRTDIAITSIPNGQALYTQLIRFCVGSDQSPEDIQALGYSEVDRIEALMLEIVEELGYNMTVEEFSKMISEDPNNYYSSEEALLDGFRHTVYNITTPAVPLIFKNIPDTPLQVMADPTSTGAFYLAGSFDGSRPGVFYVGTEDINSQPKYETLTLSLHEGNPGHHLQGSHAIESPTMTYFRSTTDDRNYGHSPSRFPLRSYYMEGWGLYSEGTGFDMDLYGDPMERYGHYADEVFRACRLVIDTGLHTFGWTRTEAIEYMLVHTAMTRLDVENEIDRYITWPGQALSYKTGQLQFTQYRTNAEEQLGDKFDIKDFHDVILESVGPMDLVKEQVEQWIQDVLSK